MPFSLRTEGFRDNPRRFAFLHGPLVLCADPADVQVNDADYPAFLGDLGRLPASLGPLPSDPWQLWRCSAGFAPLGVEHRSRDAGAALPRPR
jgi:hypothetical protein